MSGGGRVPYQYVVLRCVPRVDREEFLNVGVVLFCQERAFLGVAWRAEASRLTAAFPGLDVGQVEAALAHADGICAADPRCGSAATLPLGQRFGLLKAPRSTVLQPGPVHGGTTTDPAAELVRLRDALVG